MRKDEILNFMPKIPEDLLTIPKNSIFPEKYVRIVRQRGHLVLRLPPYYCVFDEETVHYFKIGVRKWI